MPVGQFRFTRIPIDPQVIEAATVVDRRNGYLDDRVVECIMRNLPEGTVHSRSEGLGHKLQFPRGVFSGENALIDLVTKKEVRSLNREAAETVHQLLKNCATAGRVKLEDIQKKVKGHEARRVFRTAQQMRSETGKQLPTEVSNIITKFGVSNKIDGGRTRKTRRRTRRRRM